jgi:hypothetical protein
MARTPTAALLGLLAGLVVSACGPAVAGLEDDAPEPTPAAERVAALRADVAHWEGRTIPGLEPGTFPRMHTWLAKLEKYGEDAEEAALFEEALRSQLELIRTTALRYGGGGEAAR